MEGEEYGEAGEEELKFKKTDKTARVNIAEENDDESVEKEERQYLDIEEENKEIYEKKEQIKRSFSCFVSSVLVSIASQIIFED